MSFESQFQIPLFRRSNWYRSLDQTPIPPRGRITVSVAPEILIGDDTRWIRRELEHAAVGLDGSSRKLLLREAVECFAFGTVTVPPFGSQSAEDFRDLLWWHLGLPPALVDRWNNLIVRRLEDILLNALPAPEETFWVISLPTNTFVCLEACFHAALRAGCFWVRPSHREPFSAIRFVSCLLAAGWPPNRIGLYCTAQSVLPTLVSGVDRAILYGGPNLQSSFASLGKVVVHGPGRAFALLDRPPDVARAVAWLKRLVASDAGRFCTNVGTIVCLGSADEIGDKLAGE